MPVESSQALTVLRTELTLLHAQDHPLLVEVNYEALDEALKQLDELIDLHEIKSQVVQQVQLFLLNRFRPRAAEAHPMDDHMLHTIIAGPPGSGKTTLALVLARIWGALGIIKPRRSEPEITVAQLLREREADQSWYEYLLYRQSQLLRDLRHQVFQLNPRRRGTDSYRLWQQTLKSIQELRSFNRDAWKESKEAKPQPTSLKVTIARREDLVAEYVGQTAPKTKKVLEEACGGVLFIDEAYSLCIKSNGTKDSFGEECLTVINEYMSLYPREIIVIFAGYEEKLEGLFTIQPGLRRRFAHYFRIPRYASEPLARIFRQQLERKGWVIPAEVPVESLLSTHKSMLMDGGGSTEKLALLCKLAYAQLEWRRVVTEGSSQRLTEGSYNGLPVISTEVLTYALRTWPNTSVTDMPLSMYS